VTISEQLQEVVDHAGRDRQLTGIVASVMRPSAGIYWQGAYGDCAIDREFFIASTTKLHTSAIILRLVERGVLSLDDCAVDVLGAEPSARLHVMSGVDRTSEITVRHLMSHTSGIADYFQGQSSDGSSLESAVRSGRDRPWTSSEAVDWAREIGAAFAPGTRRKALYSDTNYQLLGLVIERVTGATYRETLTREIIEPLGLTRTRLYVDPADTSPLPLRDGDHVLDIPRAMTSFGPDGGVVSTAADLMTFLRAFFEGGLFDPAVVDELGDYRRIFFPLQYGVGIARFALPRLVGGVELVGHSGLSGAFAFLAPASGTYVTGTVNNVAKPSRSFQLMLRLVRVARQS